MKVKKKKIDLVRNRKQFILLDDLKQYIISVDALLILDHFNSGFITYKTMFPFEGPSTFSVSGTTGSGKTSWIFKLLRHTDVMFSNPPKKILYAYGVWQSLFDEMERSIMNITFHEGIPNSSLVEEFADGDHNIIILDDLMEDCVKNQDIANLYTRGAHHKNISIIFINQNMFCQGKNARTISLNCHYIILFQNLRDRSQVQRLGQQVFPGESQLLLESYKNATEVKYGYLVIDLSPHTHQTFRLRTEVFPEEVTKIYLPHKNGI
jgi:hypothetical protein